MILLRSTCLLSFCFLDVIEGIQGAFREEFVLLFNCSSHTKLKINSLTYLTASNSLALVYTIFFHCMARSSLLQTLSLFLFSIKSSFFFFEMGYQIHDLVNAPQALVLKPNFIKVNVDYRTWLLQWPKPRPRGLPKGSDTTRKTAIKLNEKCRKWLYLLLTSVVGKNKMIKFYNWIFSDYQVLGIIFKLDFYIYIKLRNVADLGLLINLYTACPLIYIKFY